MTIERSRIEGLFQRAGIDETREWVDSHCRLGEKERLDLGKSLFAVFEKHNLDTLTNKQLKWAEVTVNILRGFSTRDNKQSEVGKEREGGIFVSVKRAHIG